MTAARKTTTAFATVVALLVVAVAYLVTRQPVEATHTPADKAYASGDALTDVDADPNGTTILSATMRTSKPTDLMFHVTLECAILTKLLTMNGTNANTASTAASIRVWIVQEGRGIVPISSSSSAPQNGSTPNAGGEDDKVTFCHREEGRQVTDQETGPDGIDKQQTYQDTKQANAFNWVLLNAGSGVYTYTVRADFDEVGTSCTSGFAPEETCSNALIGNRTLLIVPTKMANDISI